MLAVDALVRMERRGPRRARADAVQRRLPRDGAAEVGVARVGSRQASAGGLFYLVRGELGDDVVHAAGLRVDGVVGRWRRQAQLRAREVVERLERRRRRQRLQAERGAEHGVGRVGGRRGRWQLVAVQRLPRQAVVLPEARRRGLRACRTARQRQSSVYRTVCRICCKNNKAQFRNNKGGIMVYCIVRLADCIQRGANDSRIMWNPEHNEAFNRPEA